MPENTPNRGYPVPVANDAFEPQSRINALGVAVDADVESVDSAKVDKTTTVTAGAGLTGGGDLSTNRTIAANVGTTAGTLAAGDDSRIVNAVQPARTITAGTGLTGGGDLSANRTLAVDFTAVATASQGAKADSAVQPGDLATVATTGAYSDLSGTPTLGTAAGQNVEAFATAAQGVKADNAAPLVNIGNLLAPNLATGTDTLGDTTGFTAGPGSAVTSSTTTAADGLRSLRVERALTTGQLRAGAGGELLSGSIPVRPGLPFTAVAQVADSGDFGREVELRIYWYQADGTTSAGTRDDSPRVTTNSSFQSLRVTAVAPSGAAFASVVFASAFGDWAVGDYAYVDVWGIWQGAGGSWAPPGVVIDDANTRVKPTDSTVMQLWNPETAAWQDLASSTSVPSHASTHATGGSDPLTPAAIGAATSAQGALADTAVQPGDLGTAAAANTGDFATATQGTLATTAAQRLYHYLTPNMVSGGDTLAATTGFNVQTGTVTLAYATAEKYAGAGSIQATLGAGATFGFLNVGSPTGIPIPAARPIAFSVAMKAPAGVTASLRVQWRDAAGAAVGSPVVLDTKTADGSWQLFRAATVRPSGATHANHFFGLSSTSGGEVFYVDRVQVDDSLSTVATTGAYSDLSGTPTLSTVATSGDYDDLTDKRVEIGVACSDETTDLATGTAKVTFRLPHAMTLTAVRASVTTAPVGSALTVDINAGGASVLSTLLTIDAGEKTSTTAATPAVIGTSALADDAEITVDIDAVGSSTAGAGLKVWLIGTRA